MDPNAGPISNLHKCDVEPWNTENGLYSDKRDISCSAVKLLDEI